MLAIGRWLPTRPTNRPVNFSPSRAISNHEGYDPPFASWIVMSQRPTILSSGGEFLSEPVALTSSAVIRKHKTARICLLNMRQLLPSFQYCVDFALQSGRARG